MKNSLMNTYAPLDQVIAKGEGSYLYDTNGNKYLDLTSGIGVNCLGYNNPIWVKAVQKQAATLQHCSNIFVNPVTMELSNKITEVSNMSKVFFANSGAEANEGAIKLARKYSFDKYGNIGRNKILTLKNSFHGRTITTLKATGQPEKFHNYFFPFTEGFDYIEANNINEFKEKLTDDVCAVMMEAIQGESGIYPLDDDYVKEVVSTCKAKDVLIIFDEVQCGLARSGKLFAYNYYNVEADIVSLAKGLGGGLPIGAVLCNEKLKDTFKPGDHGSTFGGNPVCCAAGIAVLNTIANDDFYKSVAEKGNYAMSLVKEANLNTVTDVRGRGLMIGIETTLNPSEVQKEAAKKGVFVLTAGKDVIRLLPPLTISKEELKEGLNVIIDILKK